MRFSCLRRILVRACVCVYVRASQHLENFKYALDFIIKAIKLRRIIYYVILTLKNRLFIINAILALKSILVRNIKTIRVT